MNLSEFFTENPQVAIAFSGGVDSAYLLYAALQCGAKVRAYYVRSVFQPQFELDDGIRLAKELGADLRILEADVTEASPREALEAVLPETADQDICRIIFTGEADERGVDLPALESAFRERFYALELRDKTRPAQSLWARAGEDSLRGLFLREMKTQWSAAETPEERDTITLAVRFGLAALDHRELG